MENSFRQFIKYFSLGHNNKNNQNELRGIGKCPVCNSRVPSKVFACPKCGMLCGAGTRFRNKLKKHLCWKYRYASRLNETFNMYNEGVKNNGRKI